MLCIGGVDIGKQIEEIKKYEISLICLENYYRGAHIMIGTPGRLSDLLNKKKFNLNLCRFLVLDEVDRLLEAAFESELTRLLSNMKVYQMIFDSNFNV